MNIKSKVYVGILFLFIELLIVSVLSVYSIYNLSSHVNMMARNNIMSIQYVNSMLQSIDSLNEHSIKLLSGYDKIIDPNIIQLNIRLFEKELNDEENNITEPGEKELVLSVKENFNRYKDSFKRLSINRMKIDAEKQALLYSSMKSDLFKISDLNTLAILKKNEEVSSSVNFYYVWLSLIATVFLLVSFSFIFNFPKYIAASVEYSKKSREKLSKNEYHAEARLRSREELQELAGLFNSMAYRSDGYNKSLKDKKNRKPSRMHFRRKKTNSLYHFWLIS